MASNKLKQRLKKAEHELEEWVERVPVNNMGKWCKSVAVKSKQRTVNKLKRDIERADREGS
jgi:hypothetical protein